MDARLTAFALAVALTAALAASCGADSVKLRAATEDDLPATVLQAADVPATYTRFDSTRVGLGLQHKDQQLGSSAQYGVEYQLSPDTAAPGDLACIESGTSLYASPEAARAGLQQLDASLKKANFKATSAPGVGPDENAYSASAKSLTYCANYANEAAASYFVTFVRANVVGAVKLTYRQREGSIAAAGEFAKKQIADVEAALKEQ